METDNVQAKQLIHEVITNWVFWRDCCDWQQFRSAWHDDAWMTASWFQGPATEFIEASRRGVANGIRILHTLGGTTVDVHGPRAIAKTKVTIHQRAEIDGVEVDVTCKARHLDFFERRAGRWAIVRRESIYDQDRLDPLDPAAKPELDRALLDRFPESYRHLAYVQTKLGGDVRADLPCRTDARVQQLEQKGRDWLMDADAPPS
ncbi:nuclear transport factor 2 family protein [Pendulispora rubella]|uniref:Nuclear transport factor 2 family protein n=1 Tax=Pendulispora rubella TaxID=2741070 RepID=A0ABZ2KXJ5_9BACT